MNSDSFATAWKAEMESFLNNDYLAMKASMLSLEKENLDACKPLIKEILSDAFYTLLLGLDGATSIGGTQNSYTIKSESGELSADTPGSLEAAAWKAFHSGRG
ncbi:hypothetical protein EHS17_00525 [Rhodobacteraceae bacterium CH30]|nr:hypothetical protein EHS17_00525 [Rhodobacteraceae bacterium CH30]